MKKFFIVLFLVILATSDFSFSGYSSDIVVDHVDPLRTLHQELVRITQ